MTDYEMIYIFQENLNLIFTVLMSYVSIVSAFLVVGHLISAKLNVAMVSVVTGLFTLVSITMTFLMNRLTTTFIGIGGEMRKSVDEGTSSLGWHNITYEPEFLAQGAMVALTSLLILTYVGAIIFFFHQRRVGLQSL